MNDLLVRINKLPIMQHHWVQFVIYLVKNFLADNCTQKSASLTYTTLLSIVPVLTLVLVILSSVPQLADAKESIQQMIYSNLLPSSSFQVSQYFNDFANKSSNLTIIGMIALFITTIMTLFTIESTFNEIWKVEKKQTTVISLLRYWAIITLAPLLLGSAFIVSSTVQSLSFLNQQIAGYAINWAVWVQIGSVAVMTLGFVLMYWFIPRCQVKFKYALIAGVVTGIIFELLKQTFGFIVQNFTSYEKVYGAFAVLPVFLMWVYLSWNVVLLGVQISYCLTIFGTKHVNPRHALFSIMDILNVLYREHKKGNAVSEMGLRDVLGRQDMPHWYRYISFLEDNNLITITDNNQYILKRSLNDYTFWDFYKNLPYPLPHSQDLNQLKTHYSWASEWIDRLVASEMILKEKFSIPMSDIFDNIPPRKYPDTDEISHTEEESSDTDKLVVQREKVGLSGGQISDINNGDKRIKETDKQRLLDGEIATPIAINNKKYDSTGVTAKFASIRQTVDEKMIGKLTKVPMIGKLSSVFRKKTTNPIITEADRPD